MRWGALGIQWSKHYIWYAKITLIDHAIGGIIAALEAKGKLDNTWNIYSSDHGEMAGDHRLSHKAVFYDFDRYTPEHNQRSTGSGEA